jgi:hypothetical protein
MKTKKQIKEFAKSNVGKKFRLTRFDNEHITEKECVLTGNVGKDSFEFEVTSTKFSQDNISNNVYTSNTMLPSIDQISFNPDCDDFTLRFFNNITLCFCFYQ